ncbi:ciliary-associated calcium-binding coiled-coil protein 1 [Bombina bombina]|uniref:ciliary-associated calcium-binding coiled-coil protein 1 n=1 Tax=Bombina bombina TaxID=8345 RepID=UPI00235AC40B|nr:ciliary-associated calcium-binding coiled-coil protein 1 [Bombina bombina]
MENMINCKESVYGNENEDAAPYVFLTSSEIDTLLELDISGLQRKLQEFLNLKEIQTDLKECILLDYYVEGFWWGKENKFTSQQLEGFMGLLHKLLDNIENKCMSMEQNLQELGKALVGIGQSDYDKKACLASLNVDQAKDVINYFKVGLFQHYRLYECMFSVPRDVMVIGAEQTIEVVKPAETPFPAPLEEGISFEVYSKYIAPLTPIAGQDTFQVQC